MGFFVCKDLNSICYTLSYTHLQVELTMKSQLNRSPSYLIRNPYSFCFRIKVPKDLQKMVGKKELRYSLKTGIVEIANQKSQFLAVRIRSLFNSLGRGDSQLGLHPKNYARCWMSSLKPPVFSLLLFEIFR